MLCWQCCCNYEIATSKLQLHHEVAPTLRQLCKQLKIWAIHGHMVKFPQLYLKIVEKFIHDIIFIWYAGSTLWLQVQLIFPFHTVLQIFSMFLVSKVLGISKLMSYSLVDWKMSFPSLDFWSILTLFWWRLWKSMDWFLYDRCIRHERVKNNDFQRKFCNKPPSQ